MTRTTLIAGIMLISGVALAGLPDTAHASGAARAPQPKKVPKKAAKKAPKKATRKASKRKGAKQPAPKPAHPPGKSPKARKRLVPKPAPHGDPKRGRKVFTDLKCQLCHSVLSKGIGVKGGPGTPPDLSTVGRRMNAAALRSWLQQHPDHRGRKHPYPFNGTPRQLADLVAWLLTLR